MKKILEEKPSLLAWRGEAAPKPDAPKVAMSREAYIALIEVARARRPAEAFGALLGTLQRSEAEELTISVERIVSTRLVRAGMDVTPDVGEWARLQEELEDRDGNPGAGRKGADLSGGANSVVGWFYSDPGINLFPPRLDIPEASQTLAPYTNLLLLINPSTSEGGFFTAATASFVPVGGFYEAVPEPGSEPIIPWNGHVEGAARWLEIRDVSVPASAIPSEDSSRVPDALLPEMTSERAVHESPLLTPTLELPEREEQAVPYVQAQEVHETQETQPIQEIRETHESQGGSRTAPTELVSVPLTENTGLEAIQPQASNVLDSPGVSDPTTDSEIEVEKEPQYSWMPPAPMPHPRLEEVVAASVTRPLPLSLPLPASTPAPTVAPDFVDAAPRPAKQKRVASARRFILPALAGLVALAVALGLMMRGGSGGGASPAPTPTLVGSLAAVLPTSTSLPQPTQEAARPTERPLTPTPQPLPSATTGPTQVVAVVKGSNTITMQDSAFQGGFIYSDFLYRDRSAHLLYGGGADAKYRSMTGPFNLNLAQIGMKGPVAFTLVGLDSEDAAKTPIRISLNGTVIYEGPDPLPNSAKRINWGTHTWAVSPSLFKQGTNSVTVENLDRTHKLGDPVFLALDYVAISWDNTP